MANRKMIPPGGIKLPTKPPRAKNPPPSAAMAALGKEYELTELDWKVRVLHDAVCINFTQMTEFVFTTARGARQIAKALLERADELDDQMKAETGHRY